MATGRVPTTANSPLTAKGDLFGYSTTQARVAVGNDGETLLADSSTSTGLRWQAMPISQPIINGAMDIWQRGTSISLTTSAYTADRWQGYRAVAGGTISRQATSDTTNLPFIQYCARVQRNSGNTATDGIAVCQSVESVNAIPYAGRTVTISFYARAGANFSAASSVMRFRFTSSTNTDQNILLNGGTGLIDQNATLTTTWQRFSYTTTIGATAVSFGTVFDFTPVGTAGANDYFEFTGVQIDFGSVALPFRRSGGTLAGELALAQRYYYRTTPGTAYGLVLHSGYNSSTTYAQLSERHPVTMRVTPTSADYANLQILDNLGNSFAVTALSISGICSANHIVLDVGATGLTAGRQVLVRNNNNTAGYVGWSAEL